MVISDMQEIKQDNENQQVDVFTSSNDTHSLWIWAQGDSITLWSCSSIARKKMWWNPNLQKLYYLHPLPCTMCCLSPSNHNQQKSLRFRIISTADRQMRLPNTKWADNQESPIIYGNLILWKRGTKFNQEITQLLLAEQEEALSYIYYFYQRDNMGSYIIKQLGYYENKLVRGLYKNIFIKFLSA